MNATVVRTNILRRSDSVGGMMGTGAMGEGMVVVLGAGLPFFDAAPRWCRVVDMFVSVCSCVFVVVFFLLIWRDVELSLLDTRGQTSGKS